MFKSLISTAILLLFWIRAGSAWATSHDHTVALWLFDETEYPHTTLTDVSPHTYDLCLMNGGRLVRGRFGNALLTSSGSAPSVSYATIPGKICANLMRGPDGEPSGLWGPTLLPNQLLNTLAGRSWTLECWFKINEYIPKDAVLIDVGYGLYPGVTLRLDEKTQSLEWMNAYEGRHVIWPHGNLGDGKWHHMAVVSEKTVRLFVDGREKSKEIASSLMIVNVPDEFYDGTLSTDKSGIFDDSRDYSRFRRHRFNVGLGHDRTMDKPIAILLDELRISDIARYQDSFDPPGTFSSRKGRRWSAPKGKAWPPRSIGNNKVLFIDETIIDEKQGIELTVNPPRHPARINPVMRGDYSVVDNEGKVFMYVPDGYGSSEGITRLWVSEDGIHFEAPHLGIIEHEGSKENNIIIKGAPLWGTFFKDTRQDIPPEEQFKMTCWLANRGIYLYTSGDGLHWRRNEVCLLPLVSGGNAETFWNELSGKYQIFLKRDSSFNTKAHPGSGRRSVLFETSDLTGPCPFVPVPKPYFEGWVLPAVTGEGPVVFDVTEQGQVYRTRPIEYPWAPYTYLAFLWRIGSEEIRQTELAVSRDGLRWTCYGNLGWYIPSGGSFEGRHVAEALAQQGLIRRGDEIWQYAEYCEGPHGSGEKYGVRLTQRLDGFVSIDAHDGWFVTLPMIFKGNRLEVNAIVEGSLRIGIFREDGTQIDGYEVADCESLRGDDVRMRVRWRDEQDVGAFSGSPVRLKFELSDAKLFAFQFMESRSAQ